VNSYGLVKNGAMAIPDSADTILTTFSSTPTPPYHDQTGSWNLATGVYTASRAQYLMVSADITWVEGISTVGVRVLQIIYKPAIGAPVVAKESITQPNPDRDIQTPQEATIILKLETGDEAWVQVNQTSGISASIYGGNQTCIAGFEAF
jgi:hypothetical protein